MFANDTNFFYLKKDMNTVFLKVSDELQKINEWFISNKILLNMKKNKYSFFGKPSKKDDTPLAIPNNPEIVWTESIKFLGIFLDENLSWKPYIKYIENKISKNFGLLFKVCLI